ncbi:MAG TPA: catalase family peroxidase [Solirubrobacterales bacterium]
MASLYEEIVESLDELAGGPHEGLRAVHARGALCRGTFRASPEAAGLSRAAHLAGEEVPVTARLSNGSGNPHLPDADRLDGRGLAVKWHLPGDEAADSVTVSIPLFFVNSPEAFLELTRARRPDPETGQPDPARIGEFLGSHPETGAALPAILPALGPPVSYATLRYYSLHAFALVDDAGGRRWARFSWVPEAGEERLAEEEIESAAPDYLQTELAERIAAGPVRFAYVATLAGDGDPLEDPTLPWPDDRERVELGTLELTELLPDEQPGDVYVFDPMNLTDGIEPSEDRILQARPHAYSISIERRLAAGG